MSRPESNIDPSVLLTGASTLVPNPIVRARQEADLADAQAQVQQRQAQAQALIDAHQEAVTKYNEEQAIKQYATDTQAAGKPITSAGVMAVAPRFGSDWAKNYFANQEKENSIAATNLANQQKQFADHQAHLDAIAEVQREALKIPQAERMARVPDILNNLMATGHINQDQANAMGDPAHWTDAELQQDVQLNHKALTEQLNAQAADTKQKLEAAQAAAANALAQKDAAEAKFRPIGAEGLVNTETGEVIGTGRSKSLQAKDVVLKNGQRAMLNFDPGSGKFTDPAGNDVSAQVQGEYHVPPQPQTVMITTTDENGNKVQKIVPKVAGSAFAAAPTVQEQNRRDQATIINNYADHILSLIDENPNAVGPILGRLARGETVVGTVSPEAKALGTALGSLVALQPVLHGFRGGSQTVDHFTSILGDQRLNAAALKASIKEIQKLATEIKQPNGGDGAAPSASTKGWSVKVVK